MLLSPKLQIVELCSLLQAMLLASSHNLTPKLTYSTFTPLSVRAMRNKNGWHEAEKTHLQLLLLRYDFWIFRYYHGTVFGASTA